MNGAPGAVVARHDDIPARPVSKTEAAAAEMHFSEESQARRGEFASGRISIHHAGERERAAGVIDAVARARIRHFQHGVLDDRDVVDEREQRGERKWQQSRASGGRAGLHR